VGYVEYRDAVVQWVRARQTDTVAISHFVAINAVIGACVGDDRVLIRHLDNCSITIVEVDGDGLRLIEAGEEADTLIR
jgi:broad specificity phosphatase PhoE